LNAPELLRCKPSLTWGSKKRKYTHSLLEKIFPPKYLMNANLINVSFTEEPQLPEGSLPLLKLPNRKRMSLKMKTEGPRSSKMI
jgi:hypothetical protein